MTLAPSLYLYTLYLNFLIMYPLGHVPFTI
jgi:hypothetical protein